MMITKSLRLYAIQEPFAEWVLGLVTRNPVDITQYSCEDFLCYYDNEFDLDNPTQYDQVLAQAAEKHNKEMKKLAADTANQYNDHYCAIIGKCLLLTVQHS